MLSKIKWQELRSKIKSSSSCFKRRKRIVKKDKEGSTSTEYGAASSILGESWPASGKVQAEQYGQRLNYIRNVRLDEKGRLHYILENGQDLEELDGICMYKIPEKERAFEEKALVIGTGILNVGGKALLVSTKTKIIYKPDYKIISIKPYRFLTLEVERI